MALTGTLREFGLVDLLSLVRVTRKSGVLSIRSQADALDLNFRDGRLVRFATSPDGVDLGQMMLTAGRVSQEQIDTLPGDIASSEKAVAVALMEASGLSRADLVSFYAAQAADAVGQALMWPDGEFEFRPDVEVGEDQITFDLDVGTIIEGMRARQDQWRVLRSVLPHLHYTLRFPHARRLRVEPVVLSPAEWGIVTHVGTAGTIDEIRRQLKLDEFQVRQAVQRLVSEGLLEIEEAREDSQPGATAHEPDHEQLQAAGVGTGSSSNSTKSGRFPRLFGRKSA